MSIQGTEEWHAERLGKLTGSRIADMLARTKTGWGATRKNYMAQLMCERLTGQREEGFKSAAMERGNEVEAEARRIYGFYNNVEVEEVGFVPHSTIEMAGASPDGLVGDLGGVEFKCPNTATHLETLEGASIKRVYRLQMQFCMACTGRQWWDFVSYDPRLPPELAYYCKRVHRDQEEIDEIEREKPIIVACYTGQTAGHAVTALRLSGYADAKVLKWGMCSWNESTAAAWPANIGNVGVGHTNWTFPASLVGNMEFDDPSFQTTQTDGAAILAERVEVLLSGFNGVNNTEVLDNNGSYFINNYWAQEDVDHYGHISGARRVQPLTLAGGEYKYLSPTGPVVTYCWTGQTSSMMTSYLKVLGYDALSLKFGTNGMIYENLESHKWSDSQIMGYDLVTK